VVVVVVSTGGGSSCSRDVVVVVVVDVVVDDSPLADVVDETTVVVGVEVPVAPGTGGTGSTAARPSGVGTEVSPARIPMVNNAAVMTPTTAPMATRPCSLRNGESMRSEIYHPRPGETDSSGWRIPGSSVSWIAGKIFVASGPQHVISRYTREEVVQR
jgi:hypothetical protein